MQITTIANLTKLLSIVTACTFVTSCATMPIESRIPFPVFAEMAASRIERADAHQAPAVAIASGLALEYRSQFGIWPHSMNIVRNVGAERGFEETHLKELERFSASISENGNWVVKEGESDRLFSLTPDGTLLFTKQAFLAVVGNDPVTSSQFDPGAPSAYFLGQLLQLLK